MAGARGEGAAPLQGLFGDVLAIAKDVELAFVVGPISVLARFVESFAGIVDIIVCGDRLAVSSNFVAVGTILPLSYGHERILVDENVEGRGFSLPLEVWHFAVVVF